MSSFWQVFAADVAITSLNVHFSPILSQVNISTIAGSRHVGPIKSRVDEWGKQLNLFSETLVGTLTQVCTYNVHVYVDTRVNNSKSVQLPHGFYTHHLDRMT